MVHSRNYMLERFSNGYYIKSYWVVGDNNSLINQNEYNQIKKEYYDDNTPIVMKYGDTHFTVKGDSNVPTQTLRIDTDSVDKDDIKHNSSVEPILVAKPQFAKQFTGIGLF